MKAMCAMSDERLPRHNHCCSDHPMSRARLCHEARKKRLKSTRKALQRTLKEPSKNPKDATQTAETPTHFLIVEWQTP